MRGVAEQVNIHMKYDGYIQRQMRQVEQYQKLENKKLPESLDYNEVPSLRTRGETEVDGSETPVYRTGFANLGRVASGYIGAVGVAGA